MLDTLNSSYDLGKDSRLFFLFFHIGRSKIQMLINLELSQRVTQNNTPYSSEELANLQYIQKRKKIENSEVFIPWRLCLLLSILIRLLSIIKVLLIYYGQISESQLVKNIYKSLKFYKLYCLQFGYERYFQPKRSKTSKLNVLFSINPKYTYYSQSYTRKKCKNFKY